MIVNDGMFGHWDGKQVQMALRLGWQSQSGTAQGGLRYLLHQSWYVYGTHGK